MLCKRQLLLYDNFENKMSLFTWSLTSIVWDLHNLWCVRISPRNAEYWNVAYWKAEPHVWWKCRHESFRRLVRVLQCSSSPYCMCLFEQTSTRNTFLSNSTNSMSYTRNPSTKAILTPTVPHGRICTWARVFIL